MQSKEGQTQTYFQTNKMERINPLQTFHERTKKYIYISRRKIVDPKERSSEGEERKYHIHLNKYKLHKIIVISNISGVKTK